MPNETTQMTRNNLTFKCSEPSWANACVGNNGHPTYVEYAIGFSAAAHLMLDEIIKNRGSKYPVDTFIYPICFNMRHSVELRLKGTVVQLQKLAKLKEKNLCFNLSASHDIGNIWAFIKSEAEILDKRYSFFLSKLDNYILDISDIDATGQTFRYPNSSDNNKHLVNVSNINIFVLKKRFSKLEQILDDINYFNFFIEEEYSYKTFTKNLSRARLFDLANKLPDKNAWCENNFSNIKEEIKKNFCIGSCELSKAINIIKSNYEMASLISEILPLKGLEINDLVVFFDEWIKLHGTKILKNNFRGRIDFSEQEDIGLIFESMVKNDRIEAGCLKELKQKLNYVSVSGLKALFYFDGNSESYSENYEYIYKTQLSILENPKEYDGAVSSLLEKTSVFNNILKSLYFLGHSEFAEKLIEKYDIDDCFPWLESARNGNYFLKPKIWGYSVT